MESGVYFTPLQIRLSFFSIVLFLFSFFFSIFFHVDFVVTQLTYCYTRRDVTLAFSHFPSFFHGIQLPPFSFLFFFF